MSSITRVSDQITGETLAFGHLTAEEVEATIEAATAGLTEEERDEVLEQAIAVEDDLEPGDLTDDEWAQVVVEAMAGGQVYREGSVSVWMLRPPTPTGTTPEWPRDHGGILVQGDGDDRERAWRAVRSWAEVRAEVDAAQAREDERALRAATDAAHGRTLDAVRAATIEVQGLEAALDDARRRQHAAIRDASTAGASAARIAEASGTTRQWVTKIRGGIGVRG